MFIDQYRRPSAEVGQALGGDLDIAIAAASLLQNYIGRAWS